MARTAWQQMVDTTNKQILAQERAGVYTSQFMIQLKRLADKPGMQGAIRVLQDGRIRLSTAKKFETVLKKSLETLRQYKSYGMKVARESQKQYEKRHEQLKTQYGFNEEEMQIFYKIMNKMKQKGNERNRLSSEQVKTMLKYEVGQQDLDNVFYTLKNIASDDLELLKQIEELEEKNTARIQQQNAQPVYQK